MLDMPCVYFVKTRPPIDPVRLVEFTCEVGKTKKMTRYTQRLIPIVRTTGVSLDDLEELAKSLIDPLFHEGQEGIKVS